MGKANTTFSLEKIKIDFGSMVDFDGLTERIDAMVPSVGKCTCDYPRIKCRSGSGHDLNCPIHLAWQKKVDDAKEERRKEERAGLPC
jgi:hypothetical protein|tara:strand:+ start:133 stop:393 length:261 start_codon:yes stop_codon:yes gene_type:complete